MSAETEKWKDRIAALMRKAESTQSEPERVALMDKANELLVKWGIDRAMVEAREEREGKDHTVVAHACNFPGVKGGTRDEYILLFHRVFLGLGNLRTIKTPSVTEGYKLRDLTVVGFASDVEAALFLANSILVQASSGAIANWKIRLAEINERSAWMTPEQYLKRYTTAERAEIKRSYMTGFGNTVFDRLTEIRLRAEREAAAAKGSGTELVLVNRGRRVDDEFGKLFPHVIAGRGGKKRLNHDAYQQGRSDGMRADIGQKRFSGGRTEVAR